jgi:hypothetical protein
MMSLRSGAGLDGLQDAMCHAVIGELDWSPQVIRQFVGRLRRDGQQKPVTAHYIITNSGSDSAILPTLGLKASQSHGILNPWTELAETTPVDASRMKILAKHVLGEEEQSSPR